MSTTDEQVVDSTNSTDEQVIEINLDDTEDVEAHEKTYSSQEFKQVLARAKKAEAELKENKNKPVQHTQVNSTLSEETVQALILQSKGIDGELIKEMQTLAKLRGKPLIEMESDPIFIAMKNEKEAKMKAEKARLGASKGSGQQKQEKTTTTVNLSDAEHKEIWLRQRDI